MNTPKLLTFKTTVSRGRDTYGYNIVSLYVDGIKTTSCNGGGYDMQATALAMYLQREYQPQLMKIKKKAHARIYVEGDTWARDKNESGLYGMHYVIPEQNRAPHIELDGGCGISCIERIAKEAGITLTSTRTGKKSWGYFLTI